MQKLKAINTHFKPQPTAKISLPQKSLRALQAAAVLAAELAAEMLRPAEQCSHFAFVV